MPRQGYMTQDARGVGAVVLATEDVFHYERLAKALLDEALLEYDHFMGINRRRVDAAHWRHWRRDDDISVYRERRQGCHSIGATIPHLEPAAPRLARSKTTPRLLAVGSLASSLDDVLYGTVAPTAATMRIRAAYSSTGREDSFDGAVLAQIHTPTPNEPFRFLGVKWVLQRGLASTGFGLVRPRDFVFLESTGVQTRQDGSGQRVGFHIMHSVEIPQGRTSSKVQRGAFSICYLYHELANGAVDVYMTAVVQPRGNLIASLAVRAAAALLTTNWRAIALFAENKKLAWLLETHRQLHRNDPPPTSASSRCGLCTKSFKGFVKSKRRQTSCQLCSMSVCSQCAVTRTLCAEGIALHSVVSTEMAFCKKCIAVANDASASEIAREQLWERDVVVRKGRAHSQATLTRCGANGSQFYQPQQELATEVGEPDGHRHTVGGDEAVADCATKPTQIGRAACGAQYDTFMSSCRTINSTWNGSGRPTETLSIGSIDCRTSSFQDAPEDDAHRNSTADLAFVLLDSRESSGRMKALDYLPQPSSLFTNRLSRTSIVCSDQDDDDIESVYSDSSDTSSIAVLSDVSREPHAIVATQPITITEEADGHSSAQQESWSPHALASSVASSRTDWATTNQQQHPLQTQLWLRMNELRDTAESTFQIAQRNTEAFASQNPQLFRDWCFRSQPLGHVTTASR